MDKLGEIISCIQYFRESCDPMELALSKRLTVAVKLLRAGAEMREAHYNRVGMAEACAKYDKLMKGE